MNKSLIKQDLRLEYILSEYLDRYFYTEMKKRKEVKDFSRINFRTNPNEQYSGIDLILESTKGVEDNIEEKCAWYWSNHYLNTFAFELMSKNKNGNYNDGWFIKKNIKTNYYLFMYMTIDKLKYNKFTNNGSKHHQNMSHLLKTITINDIESVEAILINRDKILAELEGLSLSIDMLRNNCQEIFNYGLKYDNNRKYKWKDCEYEFHISKGKKEKPLNMLIKKKDLIDWAEQSYTITPKGYVENKK